MAAKLRALVREQTGASPEPIAARLAPGSAAASIGDRSWVLLEYEPLAALGAALLWLEGRADRGAVVVGSASAAEVGATVALRLAGFDRPPDLYVATGRVLEAIDVPDLPSAVELAGPAGSFRRDEFLHSVPRAAVSAVERLLDVALGSHPALVVESDPEGAVLTFDGLEVARFRVSDGRVTFEVGVGAHDQDARRRVVGRRDLENSTVDADIADLDVAVRAVARYRDADGPPHPLARLAKSRRLRARVVRDPALAGLPSAVHLDPVLEPRPSRGLRPERPAFAAAPGEVVVCSVGIDLDLVPSAVHGWLQVASRDPWPRLTVAVPERDAHRATRTLLRRVRREAQARLVTV